MKEYKVNLYRFDELSEKVQQSTIERERFRIMEHEMEYENEERCHFLKEILDLFGCEIGRNAECGYCGYVVDYDFKGDYPALGDWRYTAIYHDELCGKYLRRYINNYILPSLSEVKRYYTARGDKHTFSKIFRRDWRDCSFAGSCYELDFFEKFYEIISKPFGEHYSLKDLLDECLDVYFLSWHSDYEYFASDEQVREHLEGCFDERLYFADGKSADSLLELLEVA